MALLLGAAEVSSPYISVLVTNSGDLSLVLPPPHQFDGLYGPNAFRIAACFSVSMVKCGA